MPNVNYALERLIQRYDKDQDGVLNFHEFQKAITPKNDAYVMSSHRSENTFSMHSSHHHYQHPALLLSHKQHEENMMSEWKEDLKEVLMTKSRAEEILV